MSFDTAYDELVERIAQRVVQKLAGLDQPGEVEPWRLLDVNEAAECLGRSERWIREQVKRGSLGVVRLDGGALAFELEDLREFAEARRVGGSAQLRAVRGEWWQERLT